MLEPTSEIIVRACEFFDLGEFQQSNSTGGYANKNFEIQTDQGRYFVKFVVEHSIEELRLEASYVDRISSTEFPCPTYLKGANGSNVLHYNNNIIVVLPYIQGEAHDTASSERISELGRALGILHLIDSKSLKPRSTWWDSDYLTSYLTVAKQHFEKGSLKRLERKIASLEKLPANDLPASIVHGDPWPGNALFDDQRLVALVDWEEVTIGYPIFDLAYLAIHGALPYGKFDSTLFDALIKAYESARKLSIVERQHFNQVVQRIAYTNYLWLLLKSRNQSTNPENLWCTDWFWNLELNKLDLKSLD